MLTMHRMDARASTEGFSPDDPFRTFGARLSKLRRARGWFQIELARRSGIAASRISKLERSAVKPNSSELVLLSLALSIALDELVFGRPTRAEGEWRSLLRELEAVGDPREVECANRLLQALVRGLRQLNLTGG